MVRADYAFGDAGSAPEIEAGETLRFVVELVGLIPRGAHGLTTNAQGFVMQRTFPEREISVPEQEVETEEAEPVTESQEVE